MAENDIYNNKRKYDNFIKSMTKTKKRLSENQELILLLLGIPRGDKIRQFFKEHGEEINDENRKEFFNSIMIGNYTKKEVIDNITDGLHYQIATKVGNPKYENKYKQISKNFKRNYEEEHKFDKIKVFSGKIVNLTKKDDPIYQKAIINKKTSVKRSMKQLEERKLIEKKNDVYFLTKEGQEEVGKVKNKIMPYLAIIRAYGTRGGL